MKDNSNKPLNDNIILGGETQTQKLREENYNLRISLKEAQNKINEEISKREDDYKKFIRQIDEIKSENHSLNTYLKRSEEMTNSLKQKVKLYEIALKEQIKGKANAREEAIMEVDKIEDPIALVIINKLLFSEKESNKNISSNEKQMRNQRFSVRESDSSTLKTQNAFLLKQLEFAEKQLKKNETNVNFSYKNKNLEFENYIIEIFGLPINTDVVNALEKIAKAYSYFPVIQETLESCLQIITQNKFIPTQVNSLTEINEILEGWSENLGDYQELVDQLFGILQINDDELKNRKNLILSIKKLIKDNENQERNNSINQNKNNYLDSFEIFIESAKNKLFLPIEYSNDALLAKILGILNQKQISNTSFE